MSRPEAVKWTQHVKNYAFMASPAFRFKNIKEKTEEIKEEESNKEDTEVKETVKKETAKAEEKATAKKSAAKKTPIKETVYVQYLGKEINHQDIVKQVKEVWTKQLKKKVGDMKSITIYFKPEENTAYYVINDDVKGSISL